MNPIALIHPQTDPTPIFEHFRGAYATELLTAASAHFDLFGKLAKGRRPEAEFRQEIGLSQRAFVVLSTALRAMGLLQRDRAGFYSLTELAQEHLVPGSPLDVSAYLSLAAESPGVREMVERLRTNRPAGVKEDQGAAFIFREGLESAMEKAASARHLTLALAGRAKNVAPVLAEKIPLKEAKCLLDIGGGTGIYSIACLQRYPRLRAIVWDRPEVLKVAEEFAIQYGVANRLECVPGDMFVDPFPDGADTFLLSNTLHDWDIPECERLLLRCAEALPSGGKITLHDVFLNDDLDGPLAIALYSAALFTLTEGRAYSANEYREMFKKAGLRTGDILPTLVHCGILIARK